MKNEGAGGFLFCWCSGCGTAVIIIAKRHSSAVSLARAKLVCLQYKPKLAAAHKATRTCLFLQECPIFYSLCLSKLLIYAPTDAAAKRELFWITGRTSSISYHWIASSLSWLVASVLVDYFRLFSILPFCSIKPRLVVDLRVTSRSVLVQVQQRSEHLARAKIIPSFWVSDPVDNTPTTHITEFAF